MRKFIRLGVCWLFLAVATILVERAFEDVPLCWVVLAAIALAVIAVPLMFRHAIKNWRMNRTFDVPIRDAIEHLAHTIPHSFNSSERAERHMFQVLYNEMCNGNLPVVGAKGDGRAPKRISARECKKLKPREVVVPVSPAAPHGVRFDLVDESSVPEPLVEFSGPFGFSGLRVRSRDLYRIWPKNQQSNPATTQED